MSNIIFPVLRSSNWKMTRTPQWRTLVQTSASGLRTTAGLQAQPIWKWTLKNGVLQSDPTIADLQAIEGLFNTMYGMFDSFLWRDPESASLVVGPGQAVFTYYPVKFLQDSCDFDRFAYQLWECGTLAFQQVGVSLLIPGPEDQPPTGQFPAIDSATLSVVTAYSQTISGVAAIGSGSPPMLYSASEWTKRTNTFDLPITTALSSFAVSFWIDGSVPSDGVSSFKVYEAFIDVVYADSSTANLRASVATANPTGVGTVSNKDNAVDSDGTTYAEISRTHTSGLSDPPSLTLSNFV